MTVPFNELLGSDNEVPATGAGSSLTGGLGSCVVAWVQVAQIHRECNEMLV